MKKIAMLLAITVMTISCGKDKDGAPIVTPPTPPAPVVNASIIQDKFESVDGNGLHGLNELDFTTLQLGVPKSDTTCNGSYGNSGDVNGVSEGQVLIEGTDSEGIIQVGHLAYVGATPLAVKQGCQAISKERYTYKSVGDILTICMVNYPFCADYKKVQ